MKRLPIVRSCCRCGCADCPCPCCTAKRGSFRRSQPAEREYGRLMMPSDALDRVRVRPATATAAFFPGAPGAAGRRGNDSRPSRRTVRFMTLVPELSGLAPSKAFAALEQVGLQPVLIGMPTAKFDGLQGYRVACQEPAAGQDVEAGTRVALAFEFCILAFGPVERPPLAPRGSPVPKVIGLGLERAIAQLTNTNFIAVAFQPEQAVERLAITRQEPEPGAPVGHFSEVALWLD